MAHTFTLASIALITVASLFYMGFGITRLLSFPLFHGQELLIAPFVGFALLVNMGYWCGWMGWSVTVTLAVAWLLATLVNLLALRRVRGNPFNVLEHVALFVLACLMLAIALYPIWQAGRLWPIGVNGDQVLYTNVAAHLENGPLPVFPPSEWQPAMLQLALAQKYGLPLGFSYLHAIVDKLSRREAYETFAIVTAIAPVLAVLAYAALARCLFALSVRGTLIAAGLVALSPILMWVHYNSYAMHAMSLGLVPLAFGVAVLAWQQGMRQLLLAALLLSTAFVTYPIAAVVFAMGPLMVYAAQRCVWERRQLPSHLQTLGVLLAMMVIMNVPGVLYVGKFLSYAMDVQFTRQFGDVHQFAQWTDLYGLSHLRLAEGIDPLRSSPWLPPLVGGVAVLLALYGAWQTTKKARAALLSLALVDLAFIIWLRYVVNYPYGYFKALTFATFPATMALAIGVDHFGFGRKGPFQRGRIAIVIAVLVCVIALNSVNLMALSRWLAPLAVDFPTLLALREVRHIIPTSSRIHIRDATGLPLLWITYFLKDYHLSLAHYSPYYVDRDWPFYQHAIGTDLVLVDKDAPSAEPWAGTAVYENSRYKILQKDPSILVHLDFRVGASMLTPEQELRLEIRPEQLVVDDRVVPLALPLVSAPAILRLGVYAPTGAAVEVGASGRRQLVRPAHDLPVLEVPLAQLPTTVTLANVGTRSLLLEGWLELVDGQRKDARTLPRGDVFDRLQEEVLPGSGVFVASGWHGLEGGPQRWTQRVAFGIFRNPLKPLALRLEGHLPFPPDGTLPVKARVLVNGHLVGELHEPGHFAQRYAVPVEILNTSVGAELKLSLDRSLNLKALGLSEDDRELGMLVARLDLLDLDLPPDGFIDIGSGGARKYLARGWSDDESLEGSTFVWAAAQESLLQISFPESHDYRVEVRGFPFRYPSAPPQEIEVYVNGRHLQDILLDGRHWQIHSFKLPQAFVMPGINTFRFRYRYAAAPAALAPDNADRRTLAVAFDFILFRPE